MGHHSATQRSPPMAANARGSERPRIIMVTGGILLFVVGFLVTLAAIQSNHAAASSNALLTEEGDAASSISRNIYLLSGTLISLSGVVLATVGPVAGMFKGKQ